MARNRRQSSQPHSFASRAIALKQSTQRTTGMAAHRAEMGLPFGLDKFHQDLSGPRSARHLKESLSTDA
jgi:hypothetical protein